MIPEEICLRKVDTRRNGSVWKYQGPQGWPSYDSKPAEPMEDLRSGVEAISAGASVSLALCGDGSVLSWGVQDDPCLVEELAGARAVSAGSDHGAAVLADGSVVVWGGSPVVAITDASELGSKW